MLKKILTLKIENDIKKRLLNLNLGKKSGRKSMLVRQATESTLEKYDDNPNAKKTLPQTVLSEALKSLDGKFSMESIQFFTNHLESHIYTNSDSVRSVLDGIATNISVDDLSEDKIEMLLNWINSCVFKNHSYGHMNESDTEFLLDICAKLSKKISNSKLSDESKNSFLELINAFENQDDSSESDSDND